MNFDHDHPHQNFYERGLVIDTFNMNPGLVTDQQKGDIFLTVFYIAGVSGKEL
jgi:hypothetical protein